MKLSTKESLTGVLFGLPAFVGLLIFLVVPFVVSFTLSINTANPDTTHWYQYYEDVLSSQTFQLAITNTIRFVLCGVPLIVGLQLLLAMLLRRTTPKTSFVRSVFILPLVVPIASVILFFMMIFLDQGYANGLLKLVNLEPISWLGSEAAFYVLLLLYVWKNCGYGMVLFIAGLSAISPEYYEAGRMDGASERQLFLKITLPLLVPTFGFVIFVAIVNAFKIFREAFLLSGDYPDRSIYMIQHFMNNNFRNLNYQRLSVSAMVVFVIVLACMLLVFWSRRSDV